MRIETLYSIAVILALTMIITFFWPCLRSLEVYAGWASGAQRVPIALVCFALFAGGLLTGWIARDTRK